MPTKPLTIRSQNGRRAAGRNASLTALRRAPMKRARAPSLAGRSASICSRSHRASTGARPDELTAITIGERSMSAGKMKVDSSGSSTTLTAIRRARAACDTAALISRELVAATTNSAVSRCEGSKLVLRCATEPSSTRLRSSSQSSGAMSETRAPLRISSSTLRAATCPPPMTTATRPCICRNIGKWSIDGESIRPQAWTAAAAWRTLGCRPHSRDSGCSHHQRPARRFSPGWIARVQGEQPMLGNCLSCRELYGSLRARMYCHTCSSVQSSRGLTLCRRFSTSHSMG